MTKKELLEKAKRDYPIGTIFIGVGTTNKYELEGFQTANDHWETSGRIIVHCKESTGCGEYLYKDGKWAEIVSKPEVSVYPTDVKYQKGDKVKVLRKAKDRERGWNMVWIESMSLRVGTVLTVQEDNGLEGVLMKEGCRYPHFVLEKVEDVKPQFEVGKWYDFNNPDYSGKCCAKFRETPFSTEVHWAFSEYIGNSKYKLYDGSWFTTRCTGKLTDISEIQQYLPDGHVDKLPVEPVKTDLKESDTLKREDLVEGEIYRYNYCDNDTNPIIGKCTTSKSSSAIAIGSEYSDYWNPGNFSMAHHMTKATDEEKQWLNACLLCGKFIEKSKALRLTEIVNELDLAIV
jgi:hypothetical protein